MRLVALHGGDSFEIEVERHGTTGYRVRIGEKWLNADLVDAGGYVRSLRFEDGTQFSLTHHREGNRHEISLGGSSIEVEVFDPLALRRHRRDDEVSGGGVVTALMPGRVVRVLVEKGAKVKRGTGLLILEAMKMENEIPSPVDGTVNEILVEAGSTVERGADLVHIG